jgi:hypothetical protein
MTVTFTHFLSTEGQKAALIAGVSEKLVAEGCSDLVMEIREQGALPVPVTPPAPTDRRAAILAEESAITAQLRELDARLAALTAERQAIENRTPGEADQEGAVA